MQTGQNSTLYCDPGSKFLVELWPRVTIPHLVCRGPWMSTVVLYCWCHSDSTSVLLYFTHLIPITCHNWTLNHESGSQFHVEFRPGVILVIQRGILTRGQISTWILTRVLIQRGIMTGVTFRRGIMTRGHNSTWNYNPGSKFHVEIWPRVRIPHWIVIPILGHNLRLNHDSGSKFNVVLRPGVIFQSGIKTQGHNSTGVQILSVGGVVIQWPPVSGGRNSTWKIRWILSTARWIKTPRVEIQWGQNSILHRQRRDLKSFIRCFLSLSVCTYYLGWMSCLISFERCQSSCEEYGTSEYYNKSCS